MRLLLAILLLTLGKHAFADTFEQAAADYRKNNFAAARQGFEQLAESGDPRAQTVLALMYKYGEGGPGDPERSFELYLAAAEQGYAPAQYNVGLTLSEGKIVEQNLALAIKWLRRSSKAGFSRADELLEILEGEKTGSRTDELIPWSQNWDLSLPVDLRDGFASTTSPTKSIRVQLGAMSTQQGAEKLWQLLLDRFPEQFQDRPLHVRESNKGGKTVFRVQTGPFENVRDAELFCEGLRSMIKTGCLALHP